MTHETAKKLNHQRLGELVKSYLTGEPQSISTSRSAIGVTKRRDVINYDLKRKFRCVNTKSIVLSSGQCVPYGYFSDSFDQ